MSERIAQEEPLPTPDVQPAATPAADETGFGTEVDGKIVDQFAVVIRQVRTHMSELHQMLTDGKEPSINIDSARRALTRGIASLPLEERLYLETQLGEHSFAVSRDYILRLLGTKGSLKRQELMDECATLRGFDERVIGKMATQGLLLCAPDPDGDGAQDVLTLSAQGIAAWKEYDQRRMDHANRLLTPLTEQEKEQLLALLEKVVSARE